MREQPELPIFGPEDPRLDPPNPPEVKRWRSVAKAVSWRVVGTIDTLILSWVIITWLAPVFGYNEGASTAENLKTAGYIALTEVATKMVLYYVHDRAWTRVRWNMKPGKDGRLREGARRSAAKTATWRVLASLDTMLLAFIFTGNIGAAISIGGFEVFTKLALYFVHERVWSRIRLGTE